MTLSFGLDWQHAAEDQFDIAALVASLQFVSIYCNNYYPLGEDHEVTILPLLLELLKQAFLVFCMSGKYRIFEGVLVIQDF